MCKTTNLFPSCCQIPEFFLTNHAEPSLFFCKIACWDVGGETNLILFRVNNFTHFKVAPLTSVQLALILFYNFYVENIYDELKNMHLKICGKKWWLENKKNLNNLYTKHGIASLIFIREVAWEDNWGLDPLGCCEWPQIKWHTIFFLLASFSKWNEFGYKC